MFFILPLLQRRLLPKKLLSVEFVDNPQTDLEAYGEYTSVFGTTEARHPRRYGNEEFSFCKIQETTR